MERVYFKNLQVRNEFFQEIKKQSQHLGWKNIAKLISTSKSMLERW